MYPIYFLSLRYIYYHLCCIIQAGGRAAYDNKAGVGDDEEEANDAAVFDEITSRKAALKLLAAVDEMDSSVLNIKTTASKVQKLLEIDRAYEFEMVNAPNVNAKMKLESLSMHDRFHRAFKEGRLNPNNLSGYWLWTTVSLRANLRESLLNPNRFPEFKAPTRLCKFKSNEAGMFDRGYVKISGLLPYANLVITPTPLRGREQFEAKEVLQDVNIKRIRYTQEVVNARIKTGLLGSKIQYGDLANFQHVLDFSMFRANLYGPLRQPGDWDGYLHSCAFGNAFPSTKTAKKRVLEDAVSAAASGDDENL